MKRCRICQAEKPLIEFHKSSGSPDGRQYRCKPCAIQQAVLWRKSNPERGAATVKKWREANREKIRNTAMRRQYGISLERRNQLEAEQCGVCAICRKPDKKRLHVDHDHDTGAVRAMLCKPCNVGLGQFRDSPALLRAAADYLERHASVTKGHVHEADVLHSDQTNAPGGTA